MAEAYSMDSGVKEANARIERLLEKRAPVVVGISGGTASGKSFLAEKVNGDVILVDDYCKGAINGVETNFDEPETYDLDMLAKHLKELKQGKEVNLPIYDMVSRSRSGYRKFSSKGVIVVEGLFVFSPVLLKELDLKIFVECPEDKRFERRMKRDVEKGIWPKDELERYYVGIVKPMHDLHVEPKKGLADIIINNP